MIVNSQALISFIVLALNLLLNIARTLNKSSSGLQGDIKKSSAHIIKACFFISKLLSLESTMMGVSILSFRRCFMKCVLSLNGIVRSNISML